MKKVFGKIVVALCVLSVFANSGKTDIVLLDDNTEGAEKTSSGWAMVLSSTSVEPGKDVAIPFVYGITDDAVVIELDKIFNHEMEDTYFGPIIVEFQKMSADAVPNIVIDDECIVNNTGTIWLDFHMQLMVDILAPQAGFDSQIIPDGDALESVYYSENYGYNNLPVQLHFVNSIGDGVSAVPAENFFRPGIDAGQIVIITNPDMAVGTRFGLKEIPTAVPEPATLLLLGAGCAPAGFIRRGKSV